MGMGVLKKHALNLAEGPANGVLVLWPCSHTLSYAALAQVAAAFPWRGLRTGRVVLNTPALFSYGSQLFKCGSKGKAFQVFNSSHLTIIVNGISA